MAQNKTKYLRKKVLDHVLGRISFAFPSNIWLALFSADPTEEGLLANELSGNGYARVSIVSAMSDTVLASSQSSNSIDIAFPAATADWASITHAAIMDASTVGNMLYFGPAVTARIVESGETFTILAGQLTIQEL